ncbi:hypothetical protein M747DRAFT_35604 [Aspergillus niger ATCC 13496]|uniref:Uncharacterized protein n=1 Tax=Aspergillus niger ATCC 13496 TaxID=1353008 RepID=A0A370BY53_ASPNG|nr:hypothetical protein M747DRAFT_35604 [Aspergillus niger ATCC 13496]
MIDLLCRTYNCSSRAVDRITLGLARLDCWFQCLLALDLSSLCFSFVASVCASSYNGRKPILLSFSCYIQVL